MKEDFLSQRLNGRRAENAYRELSLPAGSVDFCSNDYLGIVHKRLIDDPGGSFHTGSTGSRLMAGNYKLIEETEKEMAVFHQAEAALIFNSGYDANTGLLSAIAKKGDTIIYDALSHASIRDGIRLSLANSYAFRHNDLDDLKKKLGHASGNTFIVTESVFSMDGDRAPLVDMVSLVKQYNAFLVVDEAHATGVIGDKGEGLVQHLKLQDDCFARVHTFGKALGCHGAVVLGSRLLREFLINFARSFIYTTALPESSLAVIRKSYSIFPLMAEERNHLRKLIGIFQEELRAYPILPSDTAIQALIVPGNNEVKQLANYLQQSGIDLRPVLSPTVALGTERLRIVLHAFNTENELRDLIQKITYF